MEHKGLNQHRFNDNPLEKVFAEKWNEFNTSGHTLEYLLSPSNRRESTTMTDRDSIVAATVIQWLGSPVGQSFLRQAIK